MKECKQTIPKSETRLVVRPSYFMTADFSWGEACVDFGQDIYEIIAEKLFDDPVKKALLEAIKRDLKL